MHDEFEFYAAHTAVIYTDQSAIDGKLTLLQIKTDYFLIWDCISLLTCEHGRNLCIWKTVVRVDVMWAKLVISDIKYKMKTWVTVRNE